MIKPGDFISATNVHTQPDGQTVSELIYYLVLDVSGNVIDVLPFGGSAFVYATVFEWAEAEAEYEIVVISNHTEEIIRREFISRYSNLKCQENVATKYIWNEKSVILPRCKWYFSGNGVWRERE